MSDVLVVSGVVVRFGEGNVQVWVTVAALTYSRWGGGGSFADRKRFVWIILVCLRTARGNTLEVVLDT